MTLTNDLLLRTARGESVERPPVWLMRQAGRILPEYRALRAKLSGFKELVRTPELAAEVTLQPVYALKVDAAIIFSDILVIPEAMGLDYEMVESVGPRFPTTIQTERDIDNLLEGTAAAQRLDYVYEAVRITKRTLAGRLPLIGFSGTPWTLLCYMVEGKGSKTFSKAKKLLYREPVLAHRLLQKITDTIIAYLQAKIKAGVDIVQLFDSWAGVLPPVLFQHFDLPYIKRIVTAIEKVPKIVFAKGAWYAVEALTEIDCNVIGLDWTHDPLKARQRLGTRQVLQGNLDPCQLYAAPSQIRETTREMLTAFGRHHIANLGHGVYPDTPLEAVISFVDTVRQFSYEIPD